MTMNRLITKLRDACARFTRAQDGNTVVTFAVAFIPLMGLTGAAVDYSRASALQSKMQAVADSTALMIAQTAAALSATDLQTSSSNYYMAQFSNPAATGLTVTGTYSTTTGSTVLIRATATYRTNF